MKTAAALFSLFLAAALPARAAGFSTDISDLWFNSAESGWGVNVIQQDTILFITLFAYGQNGQVVWYVGSDVRYSGSGAGGALNFTGPWYQTTGPYFGGAFNPALVTVRQVGTATFTLSSANAGTFTYIVDGVSVTKQVTRQTWANNIIAGNYIGGQTGLFTGCASSSENGYREQTGDVVVTQQGGNVQILLSALPVCTLSGGYSQAGRMGSASGTYTCNNGTSGTFTASEIEATTNALAGRATMSSSTCQWSGRFGGVRSGP
jgi:hypothetical protein